MFNQIPGGGPQQVQTAYYTGCTIHATAASRTPAALDIQKGSVLQFDPWDHDGKGHLAEDNISGDYIVAIPTASGSVATAKLGLCVVTDTPSAETNEILADSGASRPANAPRGGPVSVTTKGKVQVLVKGNITKGDRLALVTAGKQYLEPQSVGTVTQEAVVVGASTCMPVAKACETANVIATDGALMWVKFDGDGV